MKSVAASLFLAFAASAAGQALQWEQTRVALDLQPGGGKAAGEFHFKNTSDRPVVIRSVPASCSCVATKPSKTAYAPGEGGTIPFTYSPKKRWGTFAYRLYVVTDEKGIQPYQLVVEVTERPKPSLPR